MRKWACLAAFCVILGAQEASRVIDCNVIFEKRKGELEAKINELAEQKRLMSSLFNQQQDLNNQKLSELQAQEKRIEGLLNEIKEKEGEIENLIKQNEELLSQIDAKKASKVAQTYTKMKDSKAGAILNEMPLKNAAEILWIMDSKDIGRILAKMDAPKAAQITELLKKGPPFEEE